MAKEQNDTHEIKANDESVYYSGVYWNDYKVVRREMNRRISGNPRKEWYEHFKKTNKNRKFKKALIINCGNGWVERLLYEKGLFEKSVGVDYSEKLIREAKKAAKGQPLRYYVMDINTAKFPQKKFDLVINNASGHHIANIDAVFREIAAIMTDDGVFVNFDYVGPHRNQYPLKQWLLAKFYNLRLPKNLKQNLRYPHLPTMLVTDPSEAVHSELILKTFKRYFAITEHKHMGGSLAYLLLTHNENFQKAPKKAVEKWSKFIMAKDGFHTKLNPGGSMFDYWTGVPKKQTALPEAKLNAYTQQEKNRERKSQKNSGKYYALTVMQRLTIYKENIRLKTLQNKGIYAGLSKLKRLAKLTIANVRQAGILGFVKKLLLQKTNRAEVQFVRYIFVSFAAIFSFCLAFAASRSFLKAPNKYAVIASLGLGVAMAALISVMLAFPYKTKDFARKKKYTLAALALVLFFFSVGSIYIVQNNRISKTKGVALTFDEISLLPNGYYYQQNGQYFINPEHPPLVKDIAASMFWVTHPKQPPKPLPKDILLQDYAQYAWGKEFLFESGNKTETIIFLARISVLFVNSVLLFVLFLSLAKTINKRAALIALFFIAVSQFSLAHASLVTVDFMPALLSVLALVWFAGWLKQFHAAPNRVAYKPLGLAAIFTFAALMGKFSAILLLPIFVLTALCYAVLARKHLKRNWARYIFSLALFGAATLAMIVAFYAWHVRHMASADIVAQIQTSYPLARYPQWGLTVLEKITHLGVLGRGFVSFVHGLLMINNRIYKGAGGVYFMGHFYGSEGAGPLYFVILYLVKMQLAFVLLNLMAIIGGIWFAIKNKFRFSKELFMKNILPITVFLYAVLFAGIAIASTLQIGLRHILPTIIGLMVIMAIIVDKALGKALARKRLRKPAILASALVVLWMVGSVLVSFPYYLSYYNQLGGGTDNGYKIATDSNYDWGQDLKNLARWQQENNIQAIYLDGFINPFLPLSYYLGPASRRYDIHKDPALPAGSYLAVSAHQYELNRTRETDGSKKYSQYEKDQVARIGKTIFVYKIPQN